MKTHTILVALILVMAVMPACTTTYTREGQVIPNDFAEASLAENHEVDFERERMEAVVKSVEYERGAKLLRNLQWLIAQKQLAVPAVTAYLDKSGPVARANLLYVLGFTRTPESTAALASHLNHKDRIVRFEAAAGLLHHGDATAVPVLIDFLDSPDRRLRYKAIEALKERTGRDLGYQFALDQESRQEAVGRWRSWWAREKDRLMYRPVPATARQP